MKQRIMTRIGTLLLCATAACADVGQGGEEDSAPEVASTSGALIFGADNRTEVGAVTHPSVLVAAAGTAALVQNGSLSCAAGTCTLATSAFSSGQVENGTSLPLCPDAANRNQLAGASCTAFLVGPNLMVTAGHCMTSQTQCNNLSVVFGFTADATGANVVTTFNQDADVYACTSLVGQRYEGSADTQNDWAVFRVDRVVRGRAPLGIRRTGVAAVGTELVGTGHPNGLPMKVSSNGFVEVNTGTKQIRTDLDMYAGNSGSPVFELANMIVQGIHVNRAASHYVRATDALGNACAADRVCDAAGGCPVGGSGVFQAWGGVMRISGTADTNFPANLIPLRPVETLAVISG